MCEGEGSFGLAFGTPDGQGAVICVADLVSVLGVVKVHAAFPSDIVAKQDSSVPVEDRTAQARGTAARRGARSASELEAVRV